jgi:hypothetical protein
MTDILNLIVVIVIIGIIMWLINAFIPMPGAIRSLINLIALIVIIIYILQYAGLIKTILPMKKFFH